ncbi:hypothetical protein GH714_034512 [Hevea brasiliensis]|uniref:C2H2-type domain-containing protein n=1 Tax=Hevea brasiliensis TaxID=3981 RepID=A0A6A6NKJ1_HEVBR|nr:hypothetical protein GH714_034512 [Hevea brasiliensis]
MEDMVMGALLNFAGHESPGVHICHKCGWPFPNPHPSARHRRTHKKICGTIQGYKLVDSEASAHSTISDDEQLSDEDRKTPATIPPSSNSANSSQMQNTEVQGSNLSVRAQQSQDHVSSATTSFMDRSLTDCRNEESVYEPNNDKGGSTCDSNPNQLGTQTDASWENYEKTASEDLAESDAKGNEGAKTITNNADDDLTEIDTNANEEMNLDRCLVDAEVSPCDNVGEASEIVSKQGKIEDTTSDPLAAARVIQLKEQSNDELDSKISLNALPPEVKSVENVNTSTGTAQVKVDAAQGMDSASSGELIELKNGQGEGNDNVHVLSVPDDIPVVDNAEIMIRGFKDYKGGALPQLVVADSFKVINDKDNSSNFCSSLLNEGTEVSALDMHVLKDDLEQKGESSEHIVENFPDETETIMPQVKMTANESQRTEQIDALTDAAATGIEKNCSVQCPGEQPPSDYHKSSSQTSSVEHATEVFSDVNPVAVQLNSEFRQTTNFGGADDAGDYEKGKIIRCDIAENEDKRITDESCTENIIATSEPSSLSELTVNAVTKSFGGEDAADHEGGKVESYYVSKTETEEGYSTIRSIEGKLSVKTAVMPESAKSVHESNVTSENVINASERNLSENECIQLSRVSDHQEGVKELESTGNRKVQVDGADRASAAAESSNVGDNDELQKSSDNVGDVEVLQRPLDKIDDVEVLQKSSEDVTKEPQLSPLDTSSSIQNCAPVGDNSAGDFVRVVSENRSESSPNEGESKFAAQQLGASAIDFSVDSGSQTDSLEGQWALPLHQSDMPVIVDAEASNGTKASVEAEKADLKEPKALSERQHSDKSDVFEPPSFMTLVEPRDGDKAAASEIQTVQNLNQPAGWFPSLTHVTNESQGRKRTKK